MTFRDQSLQEIHSWLCLLFPPTPPPKKKKVGSLIHLYCLTRCHLPLAPSASAADTLLYWLNTHRKVHDTFSYPTICPFCVLTWQTHLFPQFTTINFYSFICFCILIAYIASNMHPDQTASYQGS